MAVFETWLRSDLKKPMRVVELSGNLFSADNGGNLIGVEVLDGGQAASLTGSVHGYVIRADGATVLVDGTLTGNRASIVLPASAYLVIGQASIVIKVGTVTVGACVAQVYRTTTDTLVDPANVIPSISELLDMIDDCEQATEDANDAAELANTKAGLADDAATLANTKAGLADAAATAANTAAGTANAAAGKIDNMTVAANGLAPGSAPTVAISEVSGHKHILFGLVKGDPGKDFHIAKTFASIAAMMAYTGTDIEAYDFAMIDTGSVQDPDTGKLYCYEPDTQDRWQYIGDLSGAQGIKGETGTGIDHITLNADYTLTIYLDDNTSYTTASIRGATGETPDITIGTVTTLAHDQQAYVTLDQSSTPEDPVFNFGIPQGEPGSAENVYGTTVPMSTTDSTKVATAINAKLDANQGSTNAGKFMRVGSTGAVSYDSPTERYSSLSDFPATGDEGKLYIAEDTGMMYVWDSEYVLVGGTSSDECEVSGDIVSFETFESKAKKLVVDIEPVQDLHGYDNPWPAGGGVNKFDGLWNGASSGFNYATNYIPVTAGESYFVVTPNITTDYIYIDWCDAEKTVLSDKYVRNSTATAPAGASYARLRAWYTLDVTNISFNYPATDKAYHPYANLCPISGWDSANVTRTGKNLWNTKPFTGVDYNKAVGTSVTLSDGADVTIENNVISFSVSSWGYRDFKTDLLRAGTYHIHFNANASTAGSFRGTRYVVGSNNVIKQTNVFNSNNEDKNESITVDNGDYIIIQIGANAAVTITISDFQIEVGSSYSSWNPYTANTAEYEFPQSAGTVYGGTLTIHQDGSGELMVDYVEVDLGTLSWGKDTSVNRFNSGGLINAKQSDTTHEKAYCSMYELLAAGQTSQRITGFTIASGGGLYIYDATQEGANTEEFKAYVSGQKLVYPITTHVTYQLTNQQVISLLQGQNNVWADCGSIDLTYYRTQTAYQVSLNTADIAELQQDTNGKADKVSSPTSGNFAGLDSNGNLTDSGHKHSDYLTGKRLTAQTLSVGSTTLTFSDAAITTSSTVEAYADVYGISPTAITVTTGQAVLTFTAQQSAVSVYIAVW